MAGGSFISQNKRRPGVYINFKGVNKPSTFVGSQGVVTFPVAMGWGDQITELLSMDLVNGNSLAKIGYTAEDAESLVYREALKHAYKAIVYRLDSGGVKASATLGNLLATALYAGVIGNNISVSVVAATVGFDVITSYKGAQKDIQRVSAITELVDNDWVEFGGVGILAATAGTALTGGLNGTISDGNYTNYMDALRAYNWQVMAFPQNNPTVHSSIIAYITNLREVVGKKVQAVLYNNSSADYEGIISTTQGYATTSETVSPEIFVAYVAGLCAGSNPDQSNTYHVVPDASSIVYGAGVTPYGDAEIEAALADGKFVLSTRQDGVVVVEQDINTFRTFTSTKGYGFSKNRVIRTLDAINNVLSLTFMKSYLGKVDNNVDGRNLFKGDIINYMNTLQGIGAIKDFDSSSDVTVGAGEAIDSIVVDLSVQPVDAIEKIYMTVWVG